MSGYSRTMGFLSVLIPVICFLLMKDSSSYDSVTDGTELVFAFMVHRHGDRTPLKHTISYLKDIENVKSLIEPWGYGQLTDAGKKTAFKTGEFIRRRYNKLISDNYDKSEMYIRSTDSGRAQNTAISVMNAIYSADKESCSQDINRVATPYTVAPAKYDFNLAIINCPKYKEFMRNQIATLALSKKSNIMERLPEVVVGEISTFSNIISLVLHDLVASLMYLVLPNTHGCEESLGYKFPTTLHFLRNEITENANEIVDKIWGNEEHLHLLAGVLLNEFFTHAGKVISGENTQKVRVYSAHDFNVYALESITRAVPRQGVPKYGSLFSLELRRVTATGQYVVLPVYLSDPHVGTERYLRVDGCGDTPLCAYDDFYALTKADLRTEDEWRSDCGFTDDLEIDSSSID